VTDSTQDNAAWMNAWLDTQRQWLTQWQASAAQPGSDPLRATLEGLQANAQSAQWSPQAADVMRQFQSLLQSSMQGLMPGANDGAGTSTAGAIPSAAFWQQLQQVFPLGYAREQQLAWQSYTRAADDYREQMQSLMKRFGDVFTQALEAVPAEAQARAAQGKPALNARELYELWIEKGETIFATLARDNAFTTAQAECGNALSRLKQAQQALMENWLKSHDLPTRSELNSVHLRLRDMSRRIVELEQQLAAPIKKTAKRAPRKQASKQPTGKPMGESHE